MATQWTLRVELQLLYIVQVVQPSDSDAPGSLSGCVQLEGDLRVDHENRFIAYKGLYAILSINWPGNSQEQPEGTAGERDWRNTLLRMLPP